MKPKFKREYYINYGEGVKKGRRKRKDKKPMMIPMFPVIWPKFQINLRKDKK